MNWNPEDYANHSDAQLKWARDLKNSLALQGDESILDVGCGDGKITADFAAAVPYGRVVGVDDSPAMVDYAQKAYSSQQYPQLSFECQDARSLNFSSEFDVCFSNAVLHWVDDHPAFLQGAYQALKSGGQLLISCGGAGNASGILQAFADVVAQTPWNQYFSTFQNPYFFYGPQDYTEWLTGFEVQRLELVPKDMTHVGKTGLEAWIRTTWMPFIEKVPVEKRATFISAVVNVYLGLNPVDVQGLTHVQMVRLEVHAVKV